MKEISFLVAVTLISFAYGLDHCAVTKNLDDSCGNNGTCKNPECVLHTTTTTAAPTKPTTKGPGAVKSSSITASATNTATAATPAGRKRRDASVTTATCSATCPAHHECLYKCTGQTDSGSKKRQSDSGSKKHVLSPMVLLVGVVTKLLIG